MRAHVVCVRAWCVCARLLAPSRLRSRAPCTPRCGRQLYTVTREEPAIFQFGERIDLGEGEVVFEEDLHQFEDNSFDAYTIAFGIRNVTDVNLALREAHRVLRKGGRFMCLEFSRVENDVLRQAYDTYSFNVIPKIGELVTDDRDSYEYLVESIRKFPDQETFEGMIRDAGFSHVSHKNFTNGVVAMHTGFKL